MKFLLKKEMIRSTGITGEDQCYRLKTCPIVRDFFFKRSSTNLEEDETAWLPNWVKGGLF